MDSVAASTVRTAAGSRGYADAVPFPAAIVRGDAVVHANARMCAAVGRTSRELVGTPLRQLFDSRRDADGLLEELRYVSGDATAAPVPARLATVRGVPVNVVLSLSRPGDGTDELLVAAVLPEQGNDTGALREEGRRWDDDRFRTLVEVTSDWVWEVDADGRYTYVSPMVRQILGYEPSELLGRTPFELMVPDDVDRVRRAFSEAVEARRPFRLLENTCRHRDGFRVVLETSGVPIVDRDGRLLGYRGVDRDITERRSAEAALRRSEARYRRSIEASPMGLHEYLLEPGGRLIFTGCNRAADDILGVANRSFIGRSLEEAFPALADSEIPERYRDVCRTGRPWTAEHIDYDHGEIRGAFQVHAYQTAPDRLAVLFLDVTERWSARDELRAVVDEIWRRVGEPEPAGPESDPLSRLRACLERLGGRADGA